jgi:hypothetical protein
MSRHIGSVDEIEVTVTHPKTGAKVKPTSFVLLVKRPNGQIDTIPCLETSEGVFEGVYEYTEAGPFIYSAKPSPPYKASQPQEVQVKGTYSP